MYLTPISFAKPNFSSNEDRPFGIDICRQLNLEKEIEEAKKPSPDQRYVTLRRNIGDEFHPVKVNLEFYKSGKIKDVEIKYKNGKFAEGVIKESYDEEGNNINYEA